VNPKTPDFSAHLGFLAATGNGAALTLAERLRRACDRLGQARVPGLRRHLQPAPSAPRPRILCGLLLPHPDPSFTRQRSSGLSTRPATHTRQGHRNPASRWPAPSLRTPRGLTALSTSLRFDREAAGSISSGTLESEMRISRSSDRPFGSACGPSSSHRNWPLLAFSPVLILLQMRYLVGTGRNRLCSAQVCLSLDR
jgi:hypothetical protein